MTTPDSAQQKDPASQAHFGLLGRTLGHSWSPRIHTSLGSTPYSLFEVEPDDVEAFLYGGSWCGINVTIPYKRIAAELSHKKSTRVQRLGVANTLVRLHDGSLYADNTDILGFSWMLNRFCERNLSGSAHEVLSGKKVLVLGTGGASEAVLASLQDDAQAEVVRISRTGSETYATLVERHRDAVLLVNTTPVGMYPNCPASPLGEGVLEQLVDLQGVLDVVYNPARTGLCLDAEELGLPYESGLAMLVAQARFSSELFMDCHFPDDMVESIEQDLIRSTSNIALIGMPGVGKSSTAAALAHQCGRPYIDLDDAFAIETGKNVADYILSQGESAFRDVETQVLSNCAKGSGLVIACGGGVVTRQENYRLLHQNGVIVMLERPIEELSVEDRPISQRDGLSKLAEQRMPLYRAWADMVIHCTGGPSSDAEVIRNKLGLL